MGMHLLICLHSRNCSGTRIIATPSERFLTARPAAPGVAVSRVEIVLNRRGGARGTQAACEQCGSAMCFGGGTSTSSRFRDRDRPPEEDLMACVVARQRPTLHARE